MFPTLRCCLLFLFASCPLITPGSSALNARSLIAKILVEYTAIVPPNDSETLRVGLTLSLQHVGKMDEKQGTVKMGFWLRQNWTDHALEWNRTRYNVSSIFLPRRIMWIPDTVIRQGDVLKENESRDIMATENGEVTSSSSFDVILPCVPREDSKSDTTVKSDDDSGVGNPAQHAVVCSLAIGSWIEPAKNLEYKAVLVDTDGCHESSAADWKLSGFKAHSTTEPGSMWQAPSSVVVYDFTLMKNDSLDHTLLQFITPSILTALAAMSVFSLPPLAGERILMAGLAFLGQLILAGFSVLAQIQSDDYDKLRNFMTFSTVYVFLVVMAVLLRLFVSPFLKRKIAVKHEPGEMENDEAKLISITRKRMNSALPDAIFFVFFLTLYCIGMATVFC